MLVRLFLPLAVVIPLILGPPPTSAYSSRDLLTWMQQSNLGYQVLQQALNDNQSSTASEVACVAEVRLLLLAAEAKALPALRGECPGRSSGGTKDSLPFPCSARRLGKVPAGPALWPLHRHGQLRVLPEQQSRRHGRSQVLSEPRTVREPAPGGRGR